MKIIINNKVLKNSLYLSKEEFYIILSSKIQNIIEIYAINEGVISPNTSKTLIIDKNQQFIYTNNLNSQTKITYIIDKE